MESHDNGLKRQDDEEALGQGARTSNKIEPLMALEKPEDYIAQGFKSLPQGHQKNDREEGCRTAAQGEESDHLGRVQLGQDDEHAPLAGALDRIAEKAPKIFSSEA